MTIKIKPEFTEEEFAVMQQLVDAGVKAVGMPGVRAAARLLDIFELAAQVARADQLAAQNSPATPEPTAAAESATVQ